MQHDHERDAVAGAGDTGRYPKDVGALPPVVPEGLPIGRGIPTSPGHRAASFYYRKEAEGENEECERLVRHCHATVRNERKGLPSRRV